MAVPLNSFGIAHIAYELPGEPLPLETIAARGLLDTPVERLRSFGFASAFIADNPPEILALRVAERLLKQSGICPDDVAAIVYAGSVPESHAVGAGDSRNAFNYPVAMLQYELGLERALAFGVSQTGCMGMTTAVRLAGDFLRANEELQHVLCVSADVLPPTAKREMLYNVISDGACAVLVTRGAERNRVLAHRQVTKGYYWDSVTMKNEIIAAYFPTARNLIRDTLAQACLMPQSIATIIPHNVSMRSWEIMLGLLGIDGEHLFADNIARIGHVIAADNWINLKDAADQCRVHSGEKLLLFNFGYGANWSCTLLEH